MSFFTGLRCRMCGASFPAEALFVCDQCLGPLEVTYDYDAIRAARHARRRSAARPQNLWRYRELLPIAGEPRTGFHSGFTPLVRADRLAPAPRRPRAVHQGRLGQPPDASPTRTASCRWRPRAPSSSASRVFACASTGNLANSVAAHAARLGLECYVFIPDNLEAGQGARRRPSTGRTSSPSRGNYDDVNRLCTQIADRYGWGFANINLRTYYAEGAKTYGFEIAEQLGWRFPQHVVSPGGRRHAAAAHRARASRNCRRSGWSTASCRGCTPRRPRAPRRSIQRARGRRRVPRAGEAEHDRQVDRHRQPGRRLPGAAGRARDRRLRRAGDRRARSSTAIQLLAETEGIFTEPAGGTTLAGDARS